MAIRFLDTDNDEAIRDLFKRLNRYLTPLKAQELRNAVYTGPFVKLVSKYADDEYWAENRIVTPESIRRMGDVEFVSELFIGVMHGPQGGSSEIIDDYYGQLEDYEDEFPGQKTTTRLFERSWKVLRRILPDIKAQRWSNKTDFYTLFVALGALMRNRSVAKDKLDGLRRELLECADKVDSRLSDEEAKVSAQVTAYVSALVKGANDKSRRAERHAALLPTIESYCEAKGK